MQVNTPYMEAYGITTAGGTGFVGCVVSEEACLGGEGFVVKSCASICSGCFCWGDIPGQIIATSYDPKR